MDLPFGSRKSTACGPNLDTVTRKCIVLVVIALASFVLVLLRFDGGENRNLLAATASLGNSAFGTRKNRFVEIPQIIWGLNNQKIAFARACLTARMLNRTLLMPSLSASLFYKEVDLLQPISFDKVFKFEKFNSLCNGFVQLGCYSDLSNQTQVLELQKGSGRRWTVEKDLDQLKNFTQAPNDQHEVIKIVGKNPFLWHDHWPVKDYAKVFECLEVVDEIAKEAEKVTVKIRETGTQFGAKPDSYVAVHMRIEKDWMIHCKKLEQRMNISEICSSKDEITTRVGNIAGLKTPTVIYLAVADSLLEDSSILRGWKDGLFPFEKKKLGVESIYQNQPYLIKSAIDYEVCVKSNVFVGNSFSTFSSLVVLDRTQKMISMGVESSCGAEDVRWPSYAYNIQGESGGPRKWMTKMTDRSLRAISYGSNDISC